MSFLVMPVAPGNIVETLGTFVFAPEGKDFEAVSLLNIRYRWSLGVEANSLYT